jgi:EAL domain-containing protein (putative c-di-GMP-specific phosphodiesterase class I)
MNTSESNGHGESFNTPAQHVALYSFSGYILGKLRRDLKRKGLHWSEEHGVLYLDAKDSAHHLHRILEDWTNAETGLLLGSVVDGEQRCLAGWHAQPIHSLLKRFATPWLPPLLANDLLFPYFQPIVSFSHGEVYGYEALIRAEVNGRVVSGGEIIEAAVAHQVLQRFDKAARIAAICQGVPLMDNEQRLFVNFAPSVVYHPTLSLSESVSACHELGITLEQITFEVIESESFPDTELLKTILDEYRQAGAHVALDDLGAGYTSLSYLVKLHPDVVKLDKDLVRGLTPRDPRAKLVKALIEFAHDLNIKVVAEGLETPSELALLGELGADLGQGYIFGRPAGQPQPVNPQGLNMLRTFQAA